MVVLTQLMHSTLFCKFLYTGWTSVVRVLCVTILQSLNDMFLCQGMSDLTITTGNSRTYVYNTDTTGTALIWRWDINHPKVSSFQRLHKNEISLASSPSFFGGCTKESIAAQKS